MDIVETFIKDVNVADCQINSFNDFIFNRINSIVEEESIVRYDYDKTKSYIVQLKNVYIDKPSHVSDTREIKLVTPNEARMRDLNYESNICVDVCINHIDGDTVLESKTVHRYIIGKLPIMINSMKCNLYKMNPEYKIKHGECDADPGGYFIINGKERVIVSQERRSYNIISYNSKTDHVEIRSMSNETGHSVLLKLGCSSERYGFYIPNIDKKTFIPIGVIFKCFGLTSDDIKDLLKDFDDTIVKGILHQSIEVQNREDAMIYLAKMSCYNVNENDYISYSEQIINNEMLPHMSSYPPKNKILFFKEMLKKLVYPNTCSSIDNISYKRLESTGILVGELFRTVYKNYIRKIQYDLKTDIFNTMGKYTNVITKDIRSSFATGNWGCSRNTFVRVGVSQVLSRLSYNATVSHLRRTTIQIGKEGKNADIRQLHQSQAFFFCVSETPEGQAVGIVKNLALMTSITNHIDPESIKEIIQQISEFKIITDISSGNFIFINGELFGQYTKNILEKLYSFRDNFLIHPHVSISQQDTDIHIYTDSGRLIRPLINISKKDKISPTSFNESLYNGSIVYRDMAELEMEVIAMTNKKISPKTKYLEIHPCLMFGLIGSIIPFPDHNQAPRNVYYSSMAKQVVSLFANNFNQRVDTCAHVLHYSQKPIVDTKISKLSGIHDQPFGVNAIVAIQCYTSFNQEDLRNGSSEVKNLASRLK